MATNKYLAIVSAALPAVNRSFGNDSAMRVGPVGWVRGTIEKVLAVVEQATGLTREQLALAVRDRATVAARELLAVVAVHRCGVRVTDVGRCLGRPADTASRWLSRGGERRLAEPSFGRQADAA